jgi:hypothetical protein
MNISKPLPIAAAVAGVLAAVGISIKLATSTNSLEIRVDELITRMSKPEETNSESLKADLDDLTDVANDPGFAKLPAAKQDLVRIHIADLKVLSEYLVYEKELSDLPKLDSVRSAAELSQILQRARQIPVPSGSTNPVVDSTRHQILATAVSRGQKYLEEGQALLTVTEAVEQDYINVINAGKLVLQQKNEPNLPARIKEVLTLAESLKTPQKDKDKPLPGGSHLTYATVFQMSGIENLTREWNKLKQTLEPALKSSRENK